MDAIGCDGVLSLGAGDEILCDGTLGIVSGPWIPVDDVPEVAVLILGLFVVAFGVKMMRKLVWSKA